MKEFVAQSQIDREILLHLPSILDVAEVLGLQEAVRRHTAQQIHLVELIGLERCQRRIHQRVLRHLAVVVGHPFDLDSGLQCMDAFNLREVVFHGVRGRRFDGVRFLVQRVEAPGC